LCRQYGHHGIQLVLQFDLSLIREAIAEDGLREPLEPPVEEGKLG
jgi:hypothetical protein